MLDKYIRTKSFSYIYSILLLAFSILIIMTGWDGFRGWSIIVVNQNLYFGIQVLTLITSAMLVLSSRLTDAMLPAMFIAVIATACYDSADKFTSPKFIWVAVPAVAAVIFHFIKYRKPFKVGRSFWGLCAVTFAVTFGGLGHITSTEYFSGTAMFYVLGLGVGMMIFYLLVKSQVDSDSPHDLARVMYLVGLLASFSIFWLYISNKELIEDNWIILTPQFGNNLSTIIMMALPFAFYYTSKRCVDVVSVIIMMLALVLSGSRGGLLMGAIEFMILLIVYAVFCEKGVGGTVKRIIYIGAFVGIVAAVWYYLPTLAQLADFTEENNLPRVEIIKTVIDKMFNEGEARVKLFKRMTEDFRANPLFGVGIGNTGNTDLYSPVKGAMNWYHMWFAQIVGSLGIVGILAYGYQLVDRVILLIKNHKLIFVTLFMSYIGLLLMSQVNPGEFCPAPYAMLAVTHFAFIEKKEEDKFIRFKKK